MTAAFCQQVPRGQRTGSPVIMAMVVAGAAGSLAACAPPRSDATAPRQDSAARDAGEGPGIDWALTPQAITASCHRAIDEARARVDASLASATQGNAAFSSLLAVETAVADMNDALIAQTLLAAVSEDDAVREASAACGDDLAAFQVTLSASPALFALASSAETSAATDDDRQLARIYREAGLHAGAGLDTTRRAEVTGLFEELGKLESAYMRALGEAPQEISISAAEAASLPPFFVATLKESPIDNAKGQKSYLVPVHYGTMEQFLTSQASGAARERFYRAFYSRGGRANVDRLERALALRDRIAHLLGFASWAAYRLDRKMAKTPERALALASEIDRKLLARGKADVAALAKLKASLGDATPFAAWDQAYHAERLAQQRHGVDGNEVRQYFPLDTVITGALALYGQLLGVTFQPLSPDRAWSPLVRTFAMRDTASDQAIGWFFLDLLPRPGKGLHYSHHRLRAGRVLPGGSYQQPIAAIIGNGPPAEPGKQPLLGHHDAIIFFHEFGHLMHDTLSTARYASLYGTSVRADFVEAPSQMFENWMWQPAVLARVSRHVVTGKPLPDDLITRMIELEHAADGAFFTRQAFFAIYDMTIHTRGSKVNTTTLWFDLAGKLMAIPQAEGTIPQASFAGFMGGYDAGYYGYLWSKVYAQDMFSEFERGGLDNAAIGMRYRQEVLGPGGSREPEALVTSFLGRPVRHDAFYRAVGLAP